VKTNSTEPVITASDAAVLLNLSRRDISYLVSVGKLEAVQDANGIWCIPQRSAEEILRRMKRQLHAQHASLDELTDAD
jgi:hypothetical protein